MKFFRLLGQIAATAAFLALPYYAAQAIIIEGTTPSGKFKAVGLTEDGRFKVDIGNTVSTSSETVTANVVLSPNTPATVLPFDSNRKSGLVCNTSVSGATVFLSSSVGLGISLDFGDCYGADDPQSHIGSLVGISSQAGSTAYIYHR